MIDRKEIKTKINNTKSERQKEKLRKEYSEKDKEVKYSVRSDKRMYMESLATRECTWKV